MLQILLEGGMGGKERFRIVEGGGDEERGREEEDWLLTIPGRLICIILAIVGQS